MPFVYSTLSQTNDYTFYRQGGESHLKVATRKITIKGGANVAAKFLMAPNGQPVGTPVGVMTEVTDEELEALESHPVFKEHKANKFISVILGKEEKVEKVVEDMAKKDKSAPRTPSDFKKVRKENSTDVVELGEA